MKSIGVNIKTHLRSDYLRQCVESIEKHFQGVPYRIYIADDSEVDADKAAYYEALRARGHFVLELPYDVGICAGRNALLEHMGEDLVLRLDDDHVMTDETDIRAMARILELVPELGALGALERQVDSWKGAEAGGIGTWQGDLDLLGRTLVKRFHDLERLQYEEVEGLRYRFSDYTRNFLLIKREMLDEIRWEDRLKIHGEHLDFMLQIRAHPFWRLGFTPESLHLHVGRRPQDLSGSYKKMRYREDQKWKVLKEKWGIEDIRSEAARRPALAQRARAAWRRLGL